MTRSAKSNMAYSDDEATESLVSKLAQFYADPRAAKARHRGPD